MLNDQTDITANAPSTQQGRSEIADFSANC